MGTIIHTNDEEGRFVYLKDISLENAAASAQGNTEQARTKGRVQVHDIDGIVP
jgi:hypothetical protein